MATVNNVDTIATDLDPNVTSQQDFISAVYLERGNMLDTEVRRIVGEIDQSNKLLSNVNTLINKANIAQYGSSEYTATTWTTNGNNIILDNGYGIVLQKDENGNNTFSLVDAQNNQLLYQNQSLIPVGDGSIADIVQVGIPVMNDMTLVLDDGTEISFETAPPATPYNPQDMSGGLANITTISITRGNQGLSVSGFNTGAPIIGAPNLDGLNLDNNSNDGYVLLESGGVHSWEYDGVNTANMKGVDPNDPNIELSGYAARKLAFNRSFNNEIDGGLPVLTLEERNMLSNTLKINYNDASGIGHLTPEEWGVLKSSLNNAKENLTGSNQLQTVQLQRAMATYNQNYDAMSNSQNKIYSLLKDILNNIK